MECAYLPPSTPPLVARSDGGFALSVRFNNPASRIVGVLFYHAAGKYWHGRPIVYAPGEGKYADSKSDYLLQGKRTYTEEEMDSFWMNANSFLKRHREEHVFLYLHSDFVTSLHIAPVGEEFVTQISIGQDFHAALKRAQDQAPCGLHLRTAGSIVFQHPTVASAMERLSQPY